MPSNIPDRISNSWPTLIKELCPVYLDHIAFFDDLPRRIADVTPPDVPGDLLAGVGESITALEVTCGPSQSEPLISLVNPMLPAIVADIGPNPGDDARLATYWTLSSINAVQCAGFPVPADMPRVEEGWLVFLAAHSREFIDSERHTLALIACGLGRPRLAPEMLAGGQKVEPFQPQTGFGFDVPSFAMYLASAIEAKAGYEDVEMAWLDFVHHFPVKLDTEMLGWPALLWAARAVYATIGGIPVSEVADELHRLVTGA